MKRSVTVENGVLIFSEGDWHTQCRGLTETFEDTSLMSQIIMGWMTHTLDPLALTMELARRTEVTSVAG